jgi:uncharacterized protein YndB with AHSA1/START domain
MKDQLHVEAERTARAKPEVIWALIADVSRYPEWGPWRAAGYRTAEAAAPPGPGTVRWLRSARRYPATVEKILVAEEPRLLAYTVIGGMPVRNYRSEVTLTPAAGGTHVRWTATWDPTIGGRMVLRALRGLYPRVVADLVAAAEKCDTGTRPSTTQCS